MSGPVLPHVHSVEIESDHCIKDKFKRSHRGSLTKEDHIGVLHVDTKGKIESDSVNGKRYFLTIINEFSRYLAVRPLKSKSDASGESLNFVRYFERQTGHQVRTLHANGGTEFNPVIADLKDNGVEIHTTTPYTAASNGLAERSYRVILELASTCLSQAKLPFKFWNYAVRHVDDCKNSVPHSMTKKVPSEVIFQKKPSNLTHIKPFGCRMHYQPKEPRQPTFQERARIGLNFYHGGGGVFHVLTREGVLRTKHMRAEENKFSGLMQFGRKDELETRESDVVSSTSNILINSDSERTDLEDSDGIDPLTYVPSTPSKHGVTPSQSDSDSVNKDKSDGFFTPDPNDDESEEMLQGRKGTSYRLRQTPHVDYAERASTSVYACAAHSKFIKEVDEPKLRMVFRSKDRSKWIQGIREELQTLNNNKTFNFVAKVPRGARILFSAVILKLKRDFKGRTARHKGLAIVHGN